jgi:hypothetical protein
VAGSTIRIALLASIAVTIVLSSTLLYMGRTMQPSSDSRAPVAAASSSPDPAHSIGAETSVRTDILPGVRLEVEEIERGVLRIISDGVRSLAWKPGSDHRYAWRLNGGGLVVGRDGSVWSRSRPASPNQEGCGDPCTLLYRLGGDEVHDVATAFCAPSGCERASDQVVVGEDGTVWAVGRTDDGDVLRSFDGDEWTVLRKAPAGGRLLQVALGRDGSVWASWRTRSGQSRVGHLTDEGWDVLDVESMDERGLIAHPLFGAVAATRDGSLVRITDAGMYTLTDDLETDGIDVVPAAGQDGSYWWLSRTTPGLLQLIRFDGLRSMAFDVGDELGDLPEILGVAPDGALWLRPEHGPSCDGGIWRFDGSTWSHYLAGVCHTAAAFGSDGAVWLQGVEGDGDDVDIYLIRPMGTG